MVTGTLTNLLEAVKVPLLLQTSLKPTEVLLLCRTFTELQKKKNNNFKSVQYQCCHKFSKYLLTGMIYKLNSKDSDKVFIGQTSRALRLRTREHNGAMFTGNRNSLLAQCSLQTKIIMSSALTMSRSLTAVPNGQKFDFYKCDIQLVNQMLLMNTFTFLTFTRPLTVPSGISVALLIYS